MYKKKKHWDRHREEKKKRRDIEKSRIESFEYSTITAFNCSGWKRRKKEEKNKQTKQPKSKWIYIKWKTSNEQPNAQQWMNAFESNWES